MKRVVTKNIEIYRSAKALVGMPFFLNPKIPDKFRNIFLFMKMFGKENRTKTHNHIES